MGNTVPPEEIVGSPSWRAVNGSSLSDDDRDVIDQYPLSKADGRWDELFGPPPREWEGDREDFRDYQSDLRDYIGYSSESFTIDPLAYLVGGGVAVVGRVVITRVGGRLIAVVVGGSNHLTRNSQVTNALERARAQERILSNLIERYPSIRRDVRGALRQVRDHVRRLEDFLQNPTVRETMSGMSREAIEAQQISRALKLAGDANRNFHQGIERMIRALNL